MPNISTLAILIRQGKSSQIAHLDPPNEFPEFLGSAFLLALLYSFLGKPRISRSCLAFPWRGFLGSDYPRIALSGENEVDMLGSGDSLHKRKRSPHVHNILGQHVCRNETSPEKKKIDTKKGLKNAKKKIRKTIRNLSEKFSAPLRPLKIFHWHFYKIRTTKKGGWV